MSKTLSGEIELSFACRGDRVIADRTYRRGNSRISANVPAAGGIPCYFLISTGGGFIEGEHYRQSIHLGMDAHAIVTTQTPNYIYKCEHGLTTRQECSVSMEKGSFLEYYIDETIPYKDAVYEQRTDIQLQEDARLILTDGLTSGWAPDGSAFSYGRIGQRIRVRRGDRLLYNDYLLIDPSRQPAAQLGFFEGFACFHSAVIIDACLDAAFVDAVRDRLARLRTSARFGVSLLEEEGVVLRILGPDADQTRTVLDAFIRFYREEVCKLAPVDLRKRNGIKL